MNHAILLSVAGIMLMAAPEVFPQAGYPNRPIRVIVPTAPSGPPDLVARLVAQELSTRWGRQVVVDNRPGAGTTIGAEMVARAPADGYTLLMSSTPLATNPASYKQLPYDALRDFAPITQTHWVPNLFLVHPSLPAKSLAEFITLARARPGEILYGSAGHGTNPHLATELFASMVQARLTHVPYKGGQPVIIDLIAGRVVMAMSSTFGLTLPHVRSGRLRALGVSSAARSKLLPEVPTVGETVPGYEDVQWAAFMAPAATPPEIIARLHKEIVAILNTPELRSRLAADGAEVAGTAPSELASFLRAEIAKWMKLAKVAGIEPE